jgi:acetyl-CoA carboxylase carboxyltransferase component
MLPSPSAASKATVAAGGIVAVIEAMKMEHEVGATSTVEVCRFCIRMGDTVRPGEALAVVRPGSTVDQLNAAVDEVDFDHVRPDLAHIVERHERALDAARPEAVAKRHRLGLRTARENVEDLVDAGTFIEFGPLAIAAQRRRRTVEELIEKSPADGMITGIGSVNGHLFGDPTARCAVLAYDYTVFAGTQGLRNHAKTDRMIHAATEGKLPLVLYAEGGGGRPGEDSGDYGETFAVFAKLSGLVPMVGIVAGRCYAGNASLLGCCDVVIATRNSNIGMGGPAMIEGGGLGVFRPEEIGPIDVQATNGVVDVVADDEADATRIAVSAWAW